MEYLTLLVFVAVTYSLLTTSYRLLMGVAGQFSVAHAAMWGTGAYAAGILTLKLGWSIWATFPAGVLFGALAGALVALPALRVSGVYLAVVTFAFQIVFVNLLRNLTDITGGNGGLPGIPALPAIGPLSTTQTVTLTAILFLLVAVGLVRLWSRGSYGLVLHVAGRDEEVLEGLGRDVRWIKIQVFAIAGGIAGLAGVCYAQFISFIGPESFTVHFSILLMSMMLIGGAATTAGPIVGATLFVALPELLSRMGLPNAVAAPLQQVLFGVLLIVFLIFRPLGLIAPRRGAAAIALNIPDAEPAGGPAALATEAAPR